MSDKQNKTAMSDEAQITRVYLSEPLRSLEDVYDELNIENGVVTVTRRIGVNEDLSLYVLETPATENLGNINIKTFKDDTYIYIKEYEGINYSAKYIINNDYLDIFATQEGLQDAVVELDSLITQTAKEINLEVSQKVGENEIISKINQTAESITIDASRVNINGTVSANGNFKVDTSGNMECHNAQINGGTIELNSDATSYDDASFKINSSDGSRGFMSSRSISLTEDSSSGIPAQIDISIYEGESPRMSLIGSNLNSSTDISSEEIVTPKLTQTSKEEDKKNFEKFKNGLDVIKAVEIYKYNLKNETDNDKKHIGFVIGEKYIYSKEITSKDNDGVDLYSMISVAYKAIQEQQEIIEDLQRQINELKGESNG